MNELENYDLLFNPQVDMGDSSKKSTEDYQVGADKGKNGVYQSIIRFVPWYQNPKNSIQEKWVSWLVDPVTQRGRFVDCPSSVGKQSSLQDMYWKLKKSESVQEQKKADVFSRRQNFSALIQIIKDENQPELEGKIMVYRFGRKIWDKINAEMKPIIGEPHNPFDLLNGKLFGLVITKVSDYNNYDQAKFVDKVIPLCIPDADGKLIPITETTDKKLVFDFLKENSPDLTKYAYKEWDQETFDYVNQVILAVTGQANVSSNYASIKETTQQSNPTPQSTGAGITSTEITLDDLTSIPELSNIPDFNLPDLPETPGIPGSLEDLTKDL